jgi:hypothetical protein
MRILRNMTPLNAKRVAGSSHIKPASPCSEQSP